MDPRLQRRIQRYGWDRAVAAYEAGWRDQLEPAQSRMLDMVALQPGERVLDVATGTGIVARHVAPGVGPTGQVTGLDLNPDMLAVARAAAEREGVAVEWREGQAEKLPFPAGSFDLVLCQFALMFFANRHAALAEMHRVLAPAGRLALSVFQGLHQHPFYRTLDGVIQRRLGMSGVQDIFALGDARHLQALLTQAGCEAVEIEPASRVARFPDPEGFLAGEIDVDTAAIPSMQHLDAQARQAITALIRDDMQAPLREVTQAGHVVLSFHVHLARARRGRA